MEVVDKHVEWLHCEQSSAAGGIFGEPEITTPIGDEHQAQIPPLITENERLQLIALPIYHDAMTDVQNRFEFGLPIPVTWVKNKLDNTQETVESAEGILGAAGTCNDLLPVPCSSCEESWSEIEKESFLLGLYIFGKNLRVVNNFLRNKGMQSVTGYYYGTFYRSAEQQKWSVYWKNKIRKSEPGKKIFKSWRRQELFSRLLPVLSDECKTRLTEVSSTFDEGKISFEKYVFSLRDTVGINSLLEAVAIGKEERDLTTKTKTQISKKSHSTCSSLTTQEIVDILKDRIGLNKERLNDLFWDAVWPRLLATGWHSEQTPNYTSQKSNYSLVFLAPGVAKFSRRSLERGSQYFNSFSEVLNKVALDPQLLGYKTEHDRLVEPQVKQSSADEQDLMNYSIEDTSLVELANLTQLSSLPVFRAADMQLSYSVSTETDHEDVNVNDAEIHSVADHLDPVIARIEDEKMDVSTNDQHVRKVKLASRQIVKRQRVTRNDRTSGEDEVKDDSRSEKKSRVVVLGMKSPRWIPVCATKESVSSESAANQAGLLSCAGGGNGQIIRQSTRNRLLSTKALEAIANGFMDLKKKKVSEV